MFERRSPDRPFCHRVALPDIHLVCFPEIIETGWVGMAAQDYWSSRSITLSIKQFSVC